MPIRVSVIRSAWRANEPARRKTWAGLRVTNGSSRRLPTPSIGNIAENLTWVGGSFDPEDFDPEKATKEMIRGLPKWRETA